MPSRPPPPKIDPVVVNAVLIAVRQAADVLCDRWTLLVLLHAHCGVTRFADFRDRCGAVGRQLTTRLTMLEEREVLVRLAYTRRPLRHAYHLTHMGLDLFDVFSAMLRWERRWHGSEGASGFVIEHRTCGGGTVAQAEHCSACGEGVSPREVTIKIRQKGLHGMPERATAYRRSATGTAAREAAAAMPLPHALGIFGDKWSIEVLMCAFVRVNTFSGFQLHTGMSTNILADRLARLAAAGVIAPVTGETGRGRYRLTEKGVDLSAVLVCVETWADNWLRDRTRSPIRLLHAACEQTLTIANPCGHCGLPLRREDCDARVR